jgi:transcriptional regulator with XRE-family HTH domain
MKKTKVNGKWVANEDIFAGAKLRELRCSRNISQECLGKAMGVTYQQIQKYEKASNRMGVGTIARVSKFLKVDPSIFFNMEGTPHEILSIETPTRQSMEFLRVFNTVKDHDSRNAILLMAQRMAG